MGLLTREQTENLVNDWISELRSEKHAQGKSYLETHQHKMCCLGLLCNLVMEKHPELEVSKHLLCSEYRFYYKGQGDHCYVPELLAADIGLNHYDGRYGRIPSDLDTLTWANDHGKTFPEIAQIIESHKATLFPILLSDAEKA